jgi:hypothetical protein
MMILVDKIYANTIGDCPLGTIFENRCYQFVGPTMTWELAEEYCNGTLRRVNGHLASIDSGFVNNVLTCIE